jgi:hypothetical protein
MERLYQLSYMLKGDIFVFSLAFQSYGQNLFFLAGGFFAQDSRKILVLVGNTASHLSTKPAVAEQTAPGYLLSEVKTREKADFAAVPIITCVFLGSTLDTVHYSVQGTYP